MRSMEWFDQGTTLFTRLLDDLTDADLDAPTRLPGWSRRHLAAHVGYNAGALTRLVHWARTGEKTPMYASQEARNTEIERGSRLPAPEIRDLVRTSAETLRSALADLPDDRWTAEVLTNQGRPIPATEIPWMRCREVWVHAVDLDAGATFQEFPDDLVDALLDDVTLIWNRKGQGPALVIDPEDRDRTWTIGDESADPVRVTAPAANLAAWLTGRGPAPAGAPAIGSWL